MSTTEPKSLKERENPPVGPVRLAVFDFDGTCIDGNSPVELVFYLLQNGDIDFVTALKTGLWGVAYKFHLPQNEAWVRSQVFKAFRGWPVEKADEYLYRFYDKKIDAMYRKKADQVIRDHKAAGEVCVLVSATFEPIVVRALDFHDFDYTFATKMKVDDMGLYTNKVDGACTEGKAKLEVIEEFANEKYGEGGWELAYAYADHYSDKPVLERARNPYCVCPGPTLKKYAAEVGWPILEW